MNLSPAQRKDFEAMPAVLKALLEAELAAGNSIEEVGHSFPAPPVGAYFKLTKPVSTRPRASGEGIDFYERNSSLYSGEFTDAKRFFFILEPPNPPPPEPDMDAIREALRARQDGYQPEVVNREARDPDEVRATFLQERISERTTVPRTKAKVETALDKFRESMVMNYERWHDGTGYDLGILKTATPEELVQIEDLLVRREVEDWRDVEALAALDTPRARVVLRKALKSGKREHATYVLRYAPHLANEEERQATLVAALEQTDFYGGLTQTLDQVQEFHPPAVMEALLRGTLKRKGENACHFAAMLMFLHGQAKSAFDWDQRPFFLRFNTNDATARRAVFQELCSKIGVDASQFLKD